MDLAWVGRISKEALSGVTLFTVIFAMFGVLNEVAGTSSVSLISQSYGRGDTERTRKISEQTISFKVVLAIITGVLLYIFLPPLLDLYTKDPLVKEAAMTYGIPRIFVLPIAFSSFSVNTIFRCTGDSKSPMKFLIVSSVLNLILDPIFMFDKVPFLGIPGFGWGVFGAALATNISQTVSFLYGFILLLMGKGGRHISIRGLFSLNKEIDLDLLRIGLPAGFQNFVNMAFNNVFMLFISSYGTTAITVAGISSKFVQFGFTPVFGFHMAGSSLVGQALGRDDETEAMHLTKIAQVMIVVVITALVLPLLIFPSLFLRIFTDDPTVLSAGYPMVRWLALSMIITSFTFGYQIAFSGAGYNRPILYAILLSRWAVQLPLAYLLVQILQVPLAWIWVCYAVRELANWGVIYFFYRKGDWKKNRV